jgi:hypothetical protein
MAMSITLDAARVRLVEGATATVADGLGVKARRLLAAADGILLRDVWKDSSEWTSAPSDAERVRLVEGAMATATVADGLGVMARRLPAAAEGLDERTPWEKRFGVGKGKRRVLEWRGERWGYWCCQKVCGRLSRNGHLCRPRLRWLDPQHPRLCPPCLRCLDPWHLHPYPSCLHQRCRRLHHHHASVDTQVSLAKICKKA